MNHSKIDYSLYETVTQHALNGVVDRIEDPTLKRLVEVATLIMLQAAPVRSWYAKNAHKYPGMGNGHAPQKYMIELKALLKELGMDRKRALDARRAYKTALTLEGKWPPISFNRQPARYARIGIGRSWPK